MADPIMAAPRDASAYARPNTRSAKKAHIAVNVESIGTSFYGGEEFHGEAACAPSRTPLDMHAQGKAEEVPEHARCRRLGCASRWPGYKARPATGSSSSGSTS